jgi:signal transduction histidine kinase
MVALLSIIMFRASKTIDRQQVSLREQVAELSKLLADNADLNARIAQANRRAADLNDQFLGRIGADLHDGPAQLLGLVLMRLGEKPARAGPRNQPKGDTTSKMRAVLRDALKEIRNISSGLVLPEIDSLCLDEALELAASAHERLTGTHVERQLSSELPEVPRAIKTCAYRLAQEGLNNAYKHGRGRGQTLIASRQDGDIRIEIDDDGPGFRWARSAPPNGHLGLITLQNRVLALGGSFEVRSEPGAGTRLIASIPFHNGAVNDAKEDSSRNHRGSPVDA